MTVLAIVLAVVDACCYAAGARLQHQALHQPTRGTTAGPRPAVVRQPRWLAGLALMASGAALHVTALRLAPVTVVQPLGVSGIVVSVLWGLRARRARLGAATGLALLAVVAGTGAFATLAARITVATSVTATAQLWAGLLVLAMVAGCTGLAGTLRGRRRCLAAAIGAGSAYGCMSVLIRAAGEEFTTSGVSPMLFGTLAALALTVLAGFWLVQKAQASGPPEVTVGCLTLVDPFVAVAIGIGLLGEAPGLTAVAVLAGLGCWALALAGVLQISRSTPAPHPRAPAPPQEQAVPDPLTRPRHDVRRTLDAFDDLCLRTTGRPAADRTPHSRP